MAGPSVLLAYMVAGIAIYIVMRALGEMAVHNPVSGSFSEYASNYIGPLAGFTTGWTYVFEMIIVALADVTAFGIYMGFWYPDVPRWIWILSLIMFLGAINLIHVKVFGELEFWLSIVKVSAIVAMILGGFGLMFYGFHAEHSGLKYQQCNQNLLWCLHLVVLKIIGIQAGESEDLKSRFTCNQCCPRIQSAATILNIVVITAAISAINSDVFGAGRMLFGMSNRGQAPQVFQKISKNGVPWMTVVVMAGVLLVGVVLNYMIPENVFIIIASIATFATVWVWLMILLSQVAMRRKLSKAEIKALDFPVIGWPYAPAFAIVFMVFILLMMGYFPDSRPAIYVGASWLLILWIAYTIWVKPKRNNAKEKSNLAQNIEMES
ncbi:hypothetical protein FQR65_LT20382 [Abscondita terminalis]|nr:hypothetical protein FQR65_LT20382 [Abscondita terminalis]